METIKKRLSFTTMPVFFDDVKDERFLDKITEGFDDGDFIRQTELVFIDNYFGMDEVTTTVDG